jgi:large subunit ribosomal protein L13
MKTFSAKGHEVQRDWFVIDATDKVLGRVASEVALRLRGKHKPEFTPHVDTGDFIVVVNAGKLRVTGTKALNKTYYRHTGYPGGIYETNFQKCNSVSQAALWRKQLKACCLKAHSATQ